MRGPSFVGHARVIGFFTLLSRILGMARDVLCSHFFGAGLMWDAFAIAYRVPNLFRRLFGEGALTAAFIPAFVSRWEGGKEAEARTLFNRVITLLTLVLLVFVAIAIGVTYLLPRIWTDPKTALFSELLRIMAPYLLLICVAAILAATLQSLRHFSMPAFAPVLLNVIWIAALFWKDIRFVAWAILIGGAVQVLVLVLPLARRGITYRPDAKTDDSVREVRAAFLPIVFGLALVQINELVDSVIAELCVPGHGAVSALYYGNQLTQLPLSLIGISIATAVFPVLSSPKEDVAAIFQKAMRVILFVAVPATVGLVLFAREIVGLIYEHGAFAATDRTAWVVRLYGAGLVFYCANQIQVRAFYAMKDTRTPVKVSASMVFFNLALNLTLVWWFREAGIALATAISGLGSFVILNVLLRRRLPGIDFGPVHRTFALSIVAAAVMGAGAWALHRFVTSRWPEFAAVLVPIAAAVAIYAAVARAFRMSEVREVLRK